MSTTVVITEPGLTSFMLAQRFTPAALQRVCAENAFVPNQDFSYAPYTAQLHKQLKKQALRYASPAFTKTEVVQLISTINK
jgi:hypothetical protein